MNLKEKNLIAKILTEYDNFRLMSPGKYSCSEECIVAFMANKKISLNLHELERRLDDALGKETTETLTDWMDQQRS
jgi:hypothetical protein